MIPGDEVFAEVTVDRPAQALDRAFSYRLPPRLRGAVELGSYVLVPFGNQQICGFVTGFTTDLGELSPESVKDIEAVLGDMAFFDQAMLSVAKRVSRYYRCRLIDVLRCALPEGLTHQVERVITLTGNEDVDKLLLKLHETAPQQARLVEALRARGGAINLSELKDLFRSGSALSSLIRALREKGLVDTATILEPPRVQPKTILTASLLQPPEALAEELQTLRKRAPKQARCLEILMQAGRPVEVAELVRLAETSHAAVRQLELKELVTCIQTETNRLPEGAGLTADKQVELTRQQADALASIAVELSADEPRPILLHGVTASGKTEVYLRVIADVLARGRQVIVLVPEISLTVQTIDIFHGRFGDRVAILHSALSAGERFDEWRRVARGQVDICVGARSAVFAPFRKLGLIVIDEEHEPSYKQDSTPRYDARRVGLWRASVSSAGVILGSATPAVESYWRARQGRYRLVEMPQRVGDRPLAQVEVVDMRQPASDRDDRGGGPLHPDLTAAIRDRAERGEQVILFLNRRGYAPVLQCTACGYTALCEHCDVSLVVHAEDGMLVCHHCDYRIPIPEQCLSCHGTELRSGGYGTERLEHWMGRHMPAIRVLRMDRDTTQRKNAHAQILARFRRQEADVLVGTQMVAKGLDFDSVTLVGVVAADVAMNLPDFRAGERTFQLLCQVAGRAGRGERRGAVMIQTYYPEHAAIEAAVPQDYKLFFEREIVDREEGQYPPFRSLTRILVQHEHEYEAEGRAEKLGRLLGDAFQTSKSWGDVLGPAPAPLAKIRGLFRYHLIVRTPGASMMQRLLDAFEPLLPDAMREGLSIDVDPLSLL